MKIGEQRKRLLRWYDRNRRRLPWRVEQGEPVDPYRILVSEIMLQQTRVSVVVPRYQEFLGLFGSVEELARASSEQVRAAWSGLGYYRRAERLHQSAQTIRERGGFPKTARALRSLPGVGEYTAAAVASIAFGEVVPVLDGNVVRVCSRLLAIEGSPSRSAIRRRYEAAASRLVDAVRPGDSNQAMMELGATVCTKTQPKCQRCPLERGCRARQQNRAAEFPSAGSVRVRKKRTWTQLVVLRKGNQGIAELLLNRRGAERAVLSRAWLLPEEGVSGSMEPGGTGEGSSEEGRRGPPRSGAELARFHHSITDTDYQVVLLCAGVPAEVEEEGGERESGSSPWRWVPLSSFDDCGRWQGNLPLPTSSMLAKAVCAIRKAGLGA